MSKKKESECFSVEPNYFEDNSVILDIDSWKEWKKKNVWRKLYKKQTYKVGVIDSFCASFSNASEGVYRNEADINPLAPITEAEANRRRAASIRYVQFIKDAENIAIGFSSSSIELQDGWRIHKDWFRCMMAQLLLRSSGEHDHLEDIPEKLGHIFIELGWGDYRDYLNPQYDDITSTFKIPYMIKTREGEMEEANYIVLIEPTSPIPCGSKWVSKKGIIYKAGLPSDDGLTIDMESVSYDDGSACKNLVLWLTPAQIFGMKRIEQEK